MHATVLGAGELGSACSLALLKNAKCSSISIFTGDEDLRSKPTNTAERRFFKAFKKDKIEIPSPLKFYNVGGEVNQVGCGPLFICSPSFSLFPPTDPAVSTVLKSSYSPQYYNFLKKWAGNSKELVQQPDGMCKQFACVFSRGLTTEGISPVTLVDSVLKESSVPVLCAAGPFLPVEWAQTSSLEGSNSTKYSGVSLTFALASESLQGNSKLMANIESTLESLFHRENVKLLVQENSAAILSLTSACALLCAFGAGVVSNVYAGNSVSALASYSQHALGATEELINDILGRPKGAPLPTAAVSILNLACTSYSSREFVLGRKLDFHFKKSDALRAVFKGATHAHLSASSEGIYNLLKSRNCRSSFYETLMDTFNTFIRASKAGEALVKEKEYNPQEFGDSHILSNIAAVDEAMMSGDEAKFDEARKNFEKSFGDASFR